MSHVNADVQEYSYRLAALNNAKAANEACLRCAQLERKLVIARAQSAMLLQERYLRGQRIRQLAERVADPELRNAIIDAATK